MAFDAQPVLEGATIRARPLRDTDRDALYAVASDPLMWAQHPVRDRYRPEPFARFFEAAMASGGALAILEHTGRLIGTSRYHGYDAQANELEIGWTFLARDHWGGRTNSELKTLMLEHAFGTVNRVIFRVGPQNLRSQRALEKIGARRAGIWADGSQRPSVVYAITRPSPGGD